MWYVIQTITGKEQELIDMIRQVMPRERKTYEQCFVICQECACRIHGVPEFHVEPLFPSYVFVQTDTPEEFFLGLKQVPRMSKLLGTDGYFWNIHEEEENFLRNMLEESGGETRKESYVIRPSLVHTDESGRIIRAEGILEKYMDKIVKQRLRKRSVIIEIPFCGKKRRIRLGIRLEGDDVPL